MYACVGVLGSGLSNPCDDILQEFAGRKGDTFSYIVLLTNYLSIVLSIPVFMITGRKYLVELVYGTNAIIALPHQMFWNGVLLLTSYLAIWHLGQLSSLIEAVSGLTDGLFMLVFPTAAALMTHQMQMGPVKRAACVALLVYGVVQFLMTLNML